MHAGLQEMCQEIKKLGLQWVKDDDALISRKAQGVFLFLRAVIYSVMIKEGMELL